MSTWRTAVALSLACIVLSACQPRKARYLRIENHLRETVSVHWIDASDYSVEIGPSDDYDFQVGDPGCFRVGEGNVLVATTPSGRRFTVGPPACMSRTWIISG